MKKLDAKRAELKVFIDKLSALNDTFESKQLSLFIIFELKTI
jgi:hypothetical protein